MNAFNNQSYQQLVGGAGLVAAAILYSCADYGRATAAAGIALAALTDAYTHRTPGILGPKPISLLNFFDVVGILAALVALAATGFADPLDAHARSLDKSIWAAFIYILSCLGYWLLLPTQPKHYESLEAAFGKLDVKRWVFVGLFTFSAAVLVLVAWLPLTKAGDWKPFAGAVAAYVIAYFGLVTVPLLRLPDAREKKFRDGLAIATFPNDWKADAEQVKFAEDYKRALVTFTNAPLATTREVVLEFDGFHRYTGRLDGLPSPISVMIPEKQCASPAAH
jgi:hypothetical protein